MEEYNPLTTLTVKENVLQDEIARIRQTASFRFGNHLVKAVERPWKIFFLPFTTLNLMWKIFREDKPEINTASRHPRNCIVLFSTDSMRGLHFDRCETLIETLATENIQIIHVTTDSNGINRKVSKSGYYSFPERGEFEGMDPKLWNHQCEILFNTIFDIFSPKTFIFDGDFPFRGMLNAINYRDGMNRYWIRESSLNYKISSLPVDGFEYFDAVIHPSYSKRTDPDINIGRSGTVFCNPIVGSSASQDEKELFRKKHVPSDAQIIFFDVGKNIDLSQKVASKLLEMDNVYLLVRNNMKIRSILFHPRTILVSDLDYSTAISIADAAVLYPDHFSIHSAFHSKTPVLSLLEKANTLDMIHSEFDSEEIPLLFLDSDTDENMIHSAVARLIDTEVQQQLRERMGGFDLHNGEDTLVDFILKYHEESDN